RRRHHDVFGPTGSRRGHPHAAVGGRRVDHLERARRERYGGSGGGGGRGRGGGGGGGGGRSGAATRGGGRPGKEYATQKEKPSNLRQINDFDFDKRAA